MISATCWKTYRGWLPITVGPTSLWERTLSFKALYWAFEQEIHNPEKSVLIALAYRDNHDEPHGCWPSIPRIAKDCGLSERSVQYCIERLVNLGLVNRKLRPHKSTFYYMPLVWLVQGVHHPGASQSPPLVQGVHPEPKVLTVRERKPRAQSRSARDRFDEEMEQRRRLEAKTLREKKEAEVYAELHVGEWRA
jgi:hypothetical protein